MEGRAAHPRPGAAPPARMPARPSRRARRQARLRRVVLVVAVLLVAAAGLLVARDHHAGGQPTASSGGPGSTTTADPPPSSFDVGIRTVTWVNPVGTAVDPATNVAFARSLTTEIRYPTTAGSTSAETAGARPADQWGPYPVVVFAHGYNVTPDTYATLLDTWVHAGFVVVAPLFPEENAKYIQSLGGHATPAGIAAENDLVNEPGDIAFVVNQVVAWARGGRPSGTPANASAAADASFLAGLADPTRLVLAGQSDGGDAVAGLAFGAAYASTYATLAVHPKAVAVLSGAEMPGPPSAYRSPGPATDVLVVQSATDECNPPVASTTLYDALGPPKWFLELSDATHLGPYVGSSPVAGDVARLTTAFFRLGLGTGSVTPATLAADAAGASGLSLSSGATAPTIPPPEPVGSVGDVCAAP